MIESDLLDRIVAPEWRWMLDLESGCGKRQRATDLTLTLLALTGARTARWQCERAARVAAPS
jgi:hypothetical protein